MRASASSLRRGRRRLGAGHSAEPDRAGVEAFEADLQAALASLQLSQTLIPTEQQFA
jgi:hypothetical protein